MLHRDKGAIVKLRFGNLFWITARAIHNPEELVALALLVSGAGIVIRLIR